MSRSLFTILSLTLAGCSGTEETPPPIAELTGTAPTVPVLIEESPVVPPLDAYPTPFGLAEGPTFLTRARDGSAGALIRFGPGREPLYFERKGLGRERFAVPPH